MRGAGIYSTFLGNVKETFDSLDIAVGDFKCWSNNCQRMCVSIFDYIFEN